MTLAFASDFDRTLFFRDEPGGFKPADMAAISAFQQAGNCFGVSTGRSLRGVLDETRGRVRFDFFILATGALILDGRQRVIRRSVVRPVTVQHLIDEVDSLGPLVIHANDTVYSFGDPLPMQTHIDHLSEVGENLYGLSVWVGEERADKLARTINNRYGAELSVSFLARLREERTFPSLEALSRQIGRDVEAAKKLFDSDEKTVYNQKGL